MEPSISPPRVHRRGTGTTRYEKEIASMPKLADDPNERKWVGPWLMGETIGKGASGRVRLGRHKRTGKLAAIKIVPKLHIGNSRMDRKSEKVMQSIRREMVVMKLIHHPHIMDMYDVYEDDNELYLLLEYIEGGELFDYLVSKGKLDPNEALSYFKQIISGVDYCHKFNICHRDLKPENLLLDGNKNIKIADFGMAALELDNGKAFLETSCGSPHYASPEIVAGKAYHGAASDIWSCGVILFALLTGRLPFDHEDMAELLSRVKAGKFEMPSGIPPAARDLLFRMLVVDPARRITMSGIISHPFFNLEFTTQFPILAPPPFYTIAKTIESIHLIDRKILDNLTTLFRGLPQREIINALLSETKTWEKAFYHLLKEYHERQSEEYGHGMSFVDFTPKDELQVVSSRGRYQNLDEYRPTSTIEGSDQKSSIPATPKPRGRPVNGNESPHRPLSQLVVIGRLWLDLVHIRLQALPRSLSIQQFQVLVLSNTVLSIQLQDQHRRLPTISTFKKEVLTSVRPITPTQLVDHLPQGFRHYL
ncbi:hypothetical protein BS47DRAFT_119079 [Hydnum rufescens UP504]|uniref:non-specific serine/threonine protein kinase n=1 Tax=Hydnum rufescens UP504 TaxID=1448309 RepID=A0A9P6B7S8_9AGAM|nr:hypothetical protein BS47DRAFT_119079 [Hydnum rufescens UP504]